MRGVASLIAVFAALLGACGGGNEGGSRPGPAKGGGAAASQPDPAQRARPHDVELGEMRSVAGGGTVLGDGGPASAAGFCGPGDMALDAAGNMYISDYGAFCEGPGGGTIRKIDTKGIIHTVAGGTGV